MRRPPEIESISHLRRARLRVTSLHRKLLKNLVKHIVVRVLHLLNGHDASSSDMAVVPSREYGMA